MRGQTLLEAAHNLVPLIEEQRPAGDQQAHLTRKVVDACGQAGLFRMTAPQEVGGLELLPSEIVKVTEVVSAADPAVGWYIQNSMPTCVASAMLSEDDRSKVFANPNTNFGYAGMPTGQAIAEDDGYRLSGKWPVVTGVEDAGWVALHAPVLDGGVPREEDGQPEIRLFLVPTRELEIIDTWRHVAAMRGTGSNAVSAPEIFVPEGFACSDTKPLVIDRPYFRVPVSVPQLSADAAAVFGILGSAIERVMVDLSAHTAAFTGEARRDQAATQELAAEITARFRAVRAGLLEITDAVSELMSAGKELPAKLRADLYASIMLIFETGRDIASRLYSGGTRDAFVRGHPLEHALRDLHAISYGMSSVRFITHSAGRVLLGGEHDHGL